MLHINGCITPGYHETVNFAPLFSPLSFSFSDNLRFFSFSGKPCVNLHWHSFSPWHRFCLITFLEKQNAQCSVQHALWSRRLAHAKIKSYRDYLDRYWNCESLFVFFHKKMMVRFLLGSVSNKRVSSCLESMICGPGQHAASFIRYVVTHFTFTKKLQLQHNILINCPALSCTKNPYKAH